MTARPRTNAPDSPGSAPDTPWVQSEYLRSWVTNFNSQTTPSAGVAVPIVGIAASWPGVGRMACEIADMTLSSSTGTTSLLPCLPLSPQGRRPRRRGLLRPAAPARGHAGGCGRLERPTVHAERAGQGQDALPPRVALPQLELRHGLAVQPGLRRESRLGQSGTLAQLPQAAPERAGR